MNVLEDTLQNILPASELARQINMATTKSISYDVKAMWMNGVGGVSAGPYSCVIGNYPSYDEAYNTAPTLFTLWREENPASDGWRQTAWVEIVSVSFADE